MPEYGTHRLRSAAVFVAFLVGGVVVSVTVGATLAHDSAPFLTPSVMEATRRLGPRLLRSLPFVLHAMGIGAFAWAVLVRRTATAAVSWFAYAFFMLFAFVGFSFIPGVVLLFIALLVATPFAFAYQALHATPGPEATPHGMLVRFAIVGLGIAIPYLLLRFGGLGVLGVAVIAVLASVIYAIFTRPPGEEGASRSLI